MRSDQIVHEPTDQVIDLDADRRTRSNTVQERRWDVAPGQIISLIAGIGFVAIGLIAVLRAGFEGSFDTPVVDVVGYTHTAWLGFGEIALGLLLMFAGSSAAGRGLSVVLGALMIIGGIVVLAVPEDLPTELGIEKDYGTVLIIVGAVVALAALLLPAWQSRRIDQTLDARG